MQATTIDEAIRQMEAIVAKARQNKDTLGIFASLYLDVTRSVREGIRHNAFADGARMERLDVVFANRYLDAHRAYQQGQSCTESWRTAFDAAKRFDLLVLQHLLMGMNAHINLDLGIAAAETVPVADLPSLEADFNKINDLLVAKIDAVQDQLSRISPLLFLVDWFGKRRDERFAEFSLVKARASAWKAASRIAPLRGEAKDLEIKELDSYVALLNKLITGPGPVFGSVVRFAKWFEQKDIGKVLDVLAGERVSG